MTADQLLRMPDDDHRHELVKGKLITMPPPYTAHGLYAGRLHRALANHLELHGGGIASVECGYKLESDPDTVRGPDVSFIASHRLPSTFPEGYWEGAPDLAIEIVSPGERARDLAQKCREYFAAGASAVWVVRPRARTVTRHCKDGADYELTERDTLTEPDLLPGFRYDLASLFAPLNRV